MTRSKVKVQVTRPLKLEILRFSKSISSAIFNVSWQMTTDSETAEQYLTFVRSRFLIICASFCVTWLRTGKGLRSVCTCFCYYNTIRQVVAAFWGGDPQFQFAKFLYPTVIIRSCIFSRPILINNLLVAQHLHRLHSRLPGPGAKLQWARSNRVSSMGRQYIHLYSP